ncbi:MAG: ABC transporter ATP-binding protein [Sporichthyaceae bacterium]
MSVLAVEVSDLVVRYGETVAVDGLTMNVAAGTLTAVLGPNGAGKTTTLEACEGYRRPQGGSVRVLGLDPWRDGRRLRPRVGVMLQAGGVYPAVKAREMLRHIAALHAHPLNADALLEQVGLSSVGNTAYRRLSGGQQQRLSLAMAVVGRPDLVFLDEPTAGLDPQARHATWELLRDLRRDGVTVVLSTHFMDEAEQLADKVVVVDRGRVVATGSPRDLVAGGTQSTLRFSGPTPEEAMLLQAELPDGSRVREVGSGDYVVDGFLDPQLLAIVTSWCAARGVMPEVDKRTLEDVFLELTGRGLRP